MKFGLLAACGLSMCLMGLAGCETLTDSQGENFVRLARTADTNGKMIPSDTEHVLLLDKPSLLSDQPIPVH